MSSVKRKRVSKKSKQSWRKHVDITDVENFLEDQRLEERLGKPFELKTDDELFQIDTNPADQKNLSAKEKKRLKLLAPPKCFSMLQPHTNVPDPITKRNRVKSKEERRNELIKRKEKQNRLKGIIKAKERRSIKDRQITLKKKQNKPSKTDFQKDIWTESEVFNIKTDQWVTEDAKIHTLRGTGNIDKTISKRPLKNSSIIPSVEVPHPGLSYNPSFFDHQNLLREVASKETQLIKEEEHLNRVTKSMFSRVTKETNEKTWITEMSEGLPSTESAQNDQNETGGNEYKTINPPVKNKKKTLKQRRKQKEQQQLENLRSLAKKEKKKVADIYKLKFLNKNIEKTQMKSEKLKEKRMKAKERKKQATKRLGSIKYEEPDLEFNLGEELTGNLRNLKKEGNLLSDRFKSLQKRNILQPTKLRNKTVAKTKRFKKPTFKDDWKITVAKASLSSK